MSARPLVLSTAAVVEPAGAVIPARWCYDPEDPHAMTLALRGPRGWVAWWMDRELLAASMLATVGVGDVVLEPFPGDGLLVTLDSPGGHAVLLCDARHAEHALSGSYALVAPGAEWARVSGELDELAADLSAQWWWSLWP